VYRGFCFRPDASTLTEVVVGRGTLASLPGRLPAIAPGRWFLVSSRPVLRLHGGAFGRGVLDPRPLLVPDGEAAKSWDVLGRLLGALVRRGLKRDGGIVALGGGTVGDVAGLAASLALRGVPVVQVPTTLLAACDSALGGKTAVDLPEGKNLAGTIHQPRLVLVDTELFSTLPPRALRAGLAEVVKTSMLDAGFHRAMARLEDRLAAGDREAFAEAVWRSLRTKARIVASDPGEKMGKRTVLNLGHTVAHALETATGHALWHGEAVAWGLLAALRVSRERAGLSPSAERLLTERALRLLAPRAAGPIRAARLAGLMARDKKSDGEGLRVVLLEAPGRPVVRRVAASELARAFAEAAREQPRKMPATVQ
jgi:3-dehydroquinate synthase